MLTCSLMVVVACLHELTDHALACMLMQACAFLTPGHWQQAGSMRGKALPLPYTAAIFPGHPAFDMPFCSVLQCQAQTTAVCWWTSSTLPQTSTYGSTQRSHDTW